MGATPGNRGNWFRDISEMHRNRVKSAFACHEYVNQ